MDEKCFVYTCPICGSHRISIANLLHHEGFTYERYVCKDCGFFADTTDCIAISVFNMKHKEPKIHNKNTTAKQLAYKVKSQDESLNYLNTLLLKGWRVITSDSLGDEIIYILERKTEE